MSDIHAEFHRDLGKSFVDSLDAKDVDVLILAGDVGNRVAEKEALPLFCQKFKHVVYVAGNHTYYGHCNVQAIQTMLQQVKQRHKNFHHLENKSVTIDGQRFLGGTLWFPYRPEDHVAERDQNDFEQISNFRQWVYRANAKTVLFLYDNVQRSDIVVTHYAPSTKSIIPQFANDSRNGFYYTDLEDLIRDRQPQLWVHGHMHTTLHYNIGDTEVVCNPFGYARQGENREFDPSWSYSTFTT